MDKVILDPLNFRHYKVVPGNVARHLDLRDSNVRDSYLAEIKDAAVRADEVLHIYNQTHGRSIGQGDTILADGVRIDTISNGSFLVHAGDLSFEMHYSGINVKAVDQDLPLGLHGDPLERVH